MSDVGRIIQLTQAIDQRLYALGYEECQRRLGRPVDSELLGELFTTDADGSVTPTALYRDVIDRLSE